MLSSLRLVRFHAGPSGACRRSRVVSRFATDGENCKASTARGHTPSSSCREICSRANLSILTRFVQPSQTIHLIRMTATIAITDLCTFSNKSIYCIRPYTYKAFFISLTTRSRSIRDLMFKKFFVRVMIRSSSCFRKSFQIALIKS